MVRCFQSRQNITKKKNPKISWNVYQNARKDLHTGGVSPRRGSSPLPGLERFSTSPWSLFDVSTFDPILSPAGI